MHGILRRIQFKQSEKREQTLSLSHVLLSRILVGDSIAIQ